MSKFVTLHGFGGSGGSELNFDVVAYESEEILLADTPSENTIGVVTTTEITSWIFSATEPEMPVDGKDGTVWFSIGTSSGVEFNALKNNAIQVYLISTKQYVGGAFVKKDFAIYMDGNWKNARYMLYDRGDQCVEITGGWTSSGLGWASGNTAKAATFESDRIVLDTGTSPISGAQTVNKIDFTGFTKILFLYKNITITNNRAFEGSICSGRNLYSTNVATTDTYDGTVNEEQVAELLLSGLQDQYYPGILAGQSRKCEVYEIWLE